MPKKRVPDSPSALLAAIAERPADRVQLFAAALMGPGERAIEDALREDAQLRSELREAVRDIDGLNEAPWLVQYVGRVDLREAIPELLQVASADEGSKSEQAARVLLAFRDSPALLALAAHVESQRWVMQHSVSALFLLGDELAWDRLAQSASQGGSSASTTLWHLAADPKIVQRDPRWIDVALKALRTGKGAEPARAVLEKTLTPELRRKYFANLPPAVVHSPASREELASARTTVSLLLAKLPPFPQPKRATIRILEELDAILGRVPPIVRALHERIDGLDTCGDKPKDRVVLYSVAYVRKQAKDWAAKHDPQHTPIDLVPRFLWPVAPDNYTKAGLSGGPAFGFELPGDVDDPILHNAPKKPSYSQFVARELRRACRMGGNEALRGGKSRDSKR